MVTIIGAFLILSGLVSSYAIAKNSSLSVQSISYLILGLGSLGLLFELFESNGELNYTIPIFLGGVLVLHFLLGEIFKNKIGLIFNIIPILGAFSLFLLPNLEGFSFNSFVLESSTEVFIIAILSAITPFLTHLAKLGIGNLVIRFGNINWAENEENYLESLVSYAFIGGVAALGNFLIGGLGLVIAATFYLSASFIARNKLGLKNEIILAASGAMFLLITVPEVLNLAGFESLNFLRAEVIEGAFIAGFMIIVHELFMKLARFNSGNWRFIFAVLSILLPVLAIVLVGFAYQAFERLGGVLSLAAIIASMAILSILFTLFKNSNFVNLKLITLGTTLLILPFVSPVERTSNINLADLGINQNDKNEGEDSDQAQEYLEISEAIGEWEIQAENSKIFFELGPDDGRTEGEFKSVSGSFNIDENVSKSTFDVLLKVKDLTTFITPRDNELMGKGYFNEEKYPEITYKSSSAKKDDKSLILSGDFTMMDVTKTIEVTVNVVGIGEKDGKKILVLTGESEIDRTEFGQSPSSKIGNIVDFELEIQAVEK